MQLEELLRASHDPRLSPEAFRLFVVIASRGDGWHEIDADELRVLLGCKSDSPVYKARERLVRCGYIEWKQGGRGHCNQYRYLGQVPEVNVDTSDKRDRYGPVVVEGRSSIPLSPPVVQIGPLATDAEQLIEAERETLGDAVKALMSYLRRRVPPDRQEPYVGRVVGALQPGAMNPNWRDATGAVIPMGRRPAIMADALNELATADEEKGRVWAAGDFGNLRNKLNGLMRQENAPEAKRATGTHGRSKRGLPPDAQDYTPTDTWSGEFKS